MWILLLESGERDAFDDATLQYDEENEDRRRCHHHTGRAVATVEARSVRHEITPVIAH
jgi:hypothetical protein